MKSYKLILLIPIFLILSIKVFGQAAVDISLVAIANSNNFPLSVGLDLTATNCIDPQLGESDLISPPPGYTEIRFNLYPYGCGPVSTYKDYRAPGNPPVFPFTGMIQHTLWWGTNNAPIDITYYLPIGVSMTIVDNITGTLLNLGPFFGQGTATIPGSYTSLTSQAYLKIEYDNISPGAATQTSVSINNGWNLLSVPLAANDMTGTTLFPEAISTFYSYNAGYNQVTTLENGKGYWAKFDSSQSVIIIGNYVPGNEISVVQGWNLIGPFAYNVVVSGITTVPPNILSSPFYGYEGGYIIPTTVLPGKGYWIKTNQNGVIQLNTGLRE